MAVIQLIQEQLDVGIGKINVSIDKSVRNKSISMKNWRHVGPFYELHMILSGAAEISVPQHIYLLQENRGILLAPNLPHIVNSYAGDFQRFYIHFTLEGSQLIKTLFPDGEPYTIFPLSEGTRETACLILNELRENKPLSLKAIRAALQLLFVFLLRDLGLKTEKAETGENLDEETRRTVIAAYFASSMPFGCGKERLARELGVSERQLGRILQELYGKSFREMLLQSRMENAAWMLQSNDKQIKEIAHALKYTSAVSFCQAFHDWYGMTPSEYREMYKAADEAGL